MRAVQVFSSRLRISSVVALLALCGPAPAWSAITTEFANVWNGTLTNPDEISGSFLTSSPAEFALDTALMTLVGGDPTGGTWFGPGGEIHLTFTNVTGVSVNDFLRQITGQFTITGGTGQFVNSTGGTGTFQSSFIYTGLGGPLQLASTVSSGTITFIPEPAVWVMLAAGFGLLGFVRIRRAAHGI